MPAQSTSTQDQSAQNESAQRARLMPWMPIYPRDIIAETGDLEAIEFGAYVLLLMHEWTVAPLPNDPGRLARIARLDNMEWFKHGQTVLDRLRRNQGLNAERRAKHERKYLSSVENGQKGGRPKSTGFVGPLGELYEEGENPRDNPQGNPNETHGETNENENQNKTQNKNQNKNRHHRATRDGIHRPKAGDARQVVFDLGRKLFPGEPIDALIQKAVNTSGRDAVEEFLRDAIASGEGGDRIELGKLAEGM